MYYRRLLRANETSGIWKMQQILQKCSKDEPLIQPGYWENGGFAIPATGWILRTKSKRNMERIGPIRGQQNRLTITINCCYIFYNLKVTFRGQRCRCLDQVRPCWLKCDRFVIVLFDIGAMCLGNSGNTVYAILLVYYPGISPESQNRL